MGRMTTEMRGFHSWESRASRQPRFSGKDRQLYESCLGHQSDYVTGSFWPIGLCYLGTAARAVNPDGQRSGRRLRGAACPSRDGR